MKKPLLVSGIIVIFLAIAGGGWWAWHAYMAHEATSVVPVEASPDVPVPPLTETYRNDTYHLSFKYPAGYSVREVSTDSGTTILIENTTDGKGIQIAISPYTDKNTTITAERIEREVPDMAVDDPQPILLGTMGEGVAFKSDNDDFGGDSREAWFVVAGHLYQISTYAAYDGLLKAIFATWSFF